MENPNNIISIPLEDYNKLIKTNQDLKIRIIELKAINETLMKLLDHKNKDKCDTTLSQP